MVVVVEPVGLVGRWREGGRGPAFHKPTGGWEGGARDLVRFSKGGVMKKATARSLVMKDANRCEPRRKQ